jgi:uncharacterized protein
MVHFDCGRPRTLDPPAETADQSYREYVDRPQGWNPAGDAIVAAHGRGSFARAGGACGRSGTEASDRTVSIAEGDPNSSMWRVQSSTHIQRGDWDTTVIAAAELSSTGDRFRLLESIKALEGGKTIFERSWDNTIACDWM